MIKIDSPSPDIIIFLEIFKEIFLNLNEISSRKNELL